MKGLCGDLRIMNERVRPFKWPLCILGGMVHACPSRVLSKGFTLTFHLHIQHISSYSLSIDKGKTITNHGSHRRESTMPGTLEEEEILVVI